MNRLNEQVFVLADPQFGCPYVFEYVPARKIFGWVELLDHKIIQNWNQIVKPLDTVLCLGDFMNGNHSMDESIRRLDSFSHQLNGKKILLRGNIAAFEFAGERVQESIAHWNLELVTGKQTRARKLTRDCIKLMFFPIFTVGPEECNDEFAFR